MNHSSILFAEPGFLEGAARTMDWMGLFNEYNRSPSGEIADFLAIRADWCAVGDDLRNAIAHEQRANLKQVGPTSVEAK